MTDQIPIVRVNESLVRKDAKMAIEAFDREMRTSLSYMFNGPSFIRDGVLSFFSSLVGIDTDFSVVVGPREKQPDGSIKHKTYHIGFNNRSGEHFCDFKVNIIRGSYFKLTYKMPNEEIISEMLKNYEFSPAHQSSGNYVTVRLYKEVASDDYEYLAKVAYDIRCHYDGNRPIKILEKGKKGTKNAVQTEGYLPTKADCEMAISVIQKSVNRTVIRKEELLAWLEQHFQNKGISLKSNWKVITERNLETWFG